jgi:hypothetical protein
LNPGVGIQLAYLPTEFGRERPPGVSNAVPDVRLHAGSGRRRGLLSRIVTSQARAMATSAATPMLNTIPAVCSPSAAAAMPSPTTGYEIPMYKTMK